MVSHPRLRLGLAACLLAVGLWGAMVAPVAAQDTDTEAFDENETEGTVDAVRYQLWGVAAITGALLVVYIWHTDPARRQRVADRRRADNELADVLALEDQFVLPSEFAGELDELPDDPDAD